jgi:hypothetical protein
MRIRPLALGVRVGAVAIACGSRTDLIGSQTGASGDGGTGPDANATQGADSGPDASVAVDSGAMVEGGATAHGADAGAAARAAALANAVAHAVAGETAAPDSGEVCVKIDLSTYDRSCNRNSDCIAVASGQVCSGGVRLPGLRHQRQRAHAPTGDARATTAT